MEILIALGVNLLTTFIKKYIEPRFGKLGVQVLVLLLATIGAVGYSFYLNNPAFQQTVLEALKVMAYAMAIYEVILKRISFFGGSVLK